MHRMLHWAPISRMSRARMSCCLVSLVPVVGRKLSSSRTNFRRPSSSPHLLRFGFFRFHSSLSCSYMPAAACRIPTEVAAGPELETVVDPFTVAAVAAIFRDAASRRPDLRQPIYCAKDTPKRCSCNIGTDSYSIGYFPSLYIH